MNKKLSLLSLASVLFAACEQSALMQMRRDNEASELRIISKERELQSQEQQRTALLSQQQTLLADLETRQMTLLELQTKLDQLRKENARIAADTAAQQKKKESLELQLKKYQADVAALQTNDRLPDSEKKKRIEELKKQISAHLKLMLAL